jgi:hypothetical protein
MLGQPARLDVYWSELNGETMARRKKDSQTLMDLQTLRTQYRVSDFVAWQRDNALLLNPDFQRRSVWKKPAKSYLIDTILRGLPIPIIFVRDMGPDLKTLKQTRDVVDGQQRLRTILSFVDRSLLKDFDESRDEFTINSAHNKVLAGKAYKDLSDDYQKRILDYQFSVHSFPSDTDDRIILQIFARMNSTGYKLNAQELRNAEFFGEFKTTALTLASEQLNRWRNWRIFTADQIARMNEFELTSEFMMLIMRGILEKNNTTIGEFYREHDGEFAEAHEVSKRFRKTMDTIEASFNADEIAALFSSRTVFYALFASIYGMQYGLRDQPRPIESFKDMQPIGHKKPSPIRSEALTKMREAGNAIVKRSAHPLSRKVEKAIRGATTDASARRILIRFLTGAFNPCRTRS